MPWVRLQYVIVVFPNHTHLLYPYKFGKAPQSGTSAKSHTITDQIMFEYARRQFSDEQFTFGFYQYMAPTVSLACICIEYILGNTIHMSG